MLLASCGGNLDKQNSETKAASDFIRLPLSGPGYYAFVTADRLWGEPDVIAHMQRAGQNWKLLGYDQVYGRIGVNDISFQNGGDMSPHGSHRNGKDIDIRPVRHDAVEGATTITSSTYSFEGTRSLITEAINPAFDIRIILFSDKNIYGSGQSGCSAPAADGLKLSYVKCWEGHHNHMHVSSR
jgi:murein endopeptidase